MMRAPFTALLVLVSGYVLWSFAFVAMYAGHALSCTADGTRMMFGVAVATWTPALAYVVHFLAHIGLIAWIWRSFPRGDGAGGLLWRGAFALAVTAAAAAATLVTGLPILLVSPCR
jgi:hypothetical protein